MNKEQLHYHLTYWRRKVDLYRKMGEAMGGNLPQKQLHEQAQAEVNVFMLEAIAELL